MFFVFPNTALTASYQFSYVVFLLPFRSKYFLNFPGNSSLTHELLKHVLLNSQIFVSFQIYREMYLNLILLHILCSEKLLYNMSFFCNLLPVLSWPSIWSIVVSAPEASQMCVCRRCWERYSTNVKYINLMDDVFKFLIWPLFFYCQLLRVGVKMIWLFVHPPLNSDNFGFVCFNLGYSSACICIIVAI